MATTLLKLKELSQQTIEAIVKSPDAWKKYLNAAPNIFRYSFEDQLLIYAQAPKATAVATYDVWNRIMYRAVKRGSSGIGLIHAKRRYEKIDYVFDVSQTVERYDSRSLNIWKVTDENESQIREYLQDMLSVDELSASIPDLMQSLVKESVEDVIDDLYDALKENVNGTYLDGLEDDQLKYEFRELLNHSIYYVCLGKCGYDPDMYVTNDAFDFITNFNDLSVLRHLGYATTETCNSILHGITICLERNRKRTSQERMVQDTVPVDFKKQDVPNFGTPEHEEIVLSSEPDNHVMRTLPEHPIQIEDVEKGENDYIQLEFLPSEEQQTEQIQLEIGSHELKNNENLILDSEIDAILRLGGGENNSQYSIAARLIKGIDQEAFAAFLSEEYGTGGKGVYLNERKISVWYDQDGLRFARGDSAQEQYDRIMTWQEVSERMISMYEQGNFLPNSIVTDAMKVTGEEYAVRLELMFRDAGILPDEMRHTEEWGDTIQAMLYEKSGQEKIMELFDEIDQAFQEDPSLPGWIQSNNKKYRRIFKELTPDRNHYVLQSMDIAIPQEQFITEDEILSTLGRGSGVSNGKERIYNYLTDISEQHSVQDRIKFLKNEYGIGGRKPGIIGAWHSSADPDVKNYSYTLVKDQLYYRENSRMYPVDLPKATEERVRGMLAIRESVRKLIALQMDENGTDEEIKEEQKQLNDVYDEFYKKYGVISSKGNKRAFSSDASYCLLCSLEILDENGELERKADMFSKRTISRAVPVTKVDTAVEALAVSMSEYARINLSYMAQLTDRSKETIIEELRGVIFFNPETQQWENNDEYLSGNVRRKLAVAREYAKDDSRYQENVHALEEIQPKDLDASEIEVRIGATWLDPEIYEHFMEDVFHTPRYHLNSKRIAVYFSKTTGEWRIKGKQLDGSSNTIAYNTYGTERINAYEILEATLNLHDARVYDRVDRDGQIRYVLNKTETMYAAQRQDSMKEAFQDWIYKDQQRRETICKTYNERFNSVRPREYDGSYLKFPGMNPEIELKPHQKNAVAHQIYGKNTLLAHCVGAGKTYEMVAAAMESKRLGLSQKALFVVPNHLTEQWGAEFLQLYPGANILVATKKDFQPMNRKKFCARIALGNYDAVIIGHSQFEKIPLSDERLKKMLENQIDDILSAIEVAKESNAENFTIKQMEKTRKQLVVKLENLNKKERKDNIVTFEELGVDRLFVDESHYYKNLYLYTKMRNVAGVSQTEAQKSTDMFNKCQYINEVNGGKGITYATGTPISNSMTELFTIQRYLQMDKLQEVGLTQFDSWAATFGETVTAIELAPEGTGYRTKTRFSRFFNVPELMSMVKEVADIKTSDQLNLPVPEVDYKTIVIKPTEEQKEYVADLGERAEQVRNGGVDSSIDNMLKITNDGRKLALDQRLIDASFPDASDGKVAECARQCYQIWKDTKEKKSAQLIFCDLSTPKNDGTFNVYDDLKRKLMDMGVPEREIAYIHNANTDIKKAELFTKVRNGQVRFLLGSTAKMGAGTNVQDRLIALHHLDVPWKPSDIEQQEGRILRQGNQNQKVQIFRYVTEGTFDSYMWQLLENKQKFIGQIMTSKSPVRSCEDVDEAVLSFAEIKALATGNPYIKEKMELDIEVAKLKVLKANHNANIYRLENQIVHEYPLKISTEKSTIRYLEEDWNYYQLNQIRDPERFDMVVEDVHYNEKEAAGKAVLIAAKKVKSKMSKESVEIGSYQGFTMAVRYNYLTETYNVKLQHRMSYLTEIGENGFGNIIRINNVLDNIPKRIARSEQNLQTLESQLEDAKVEVQKPFSKEADLKEKNERLSELNALLNMDETNSPVIEEEQIEEQQIVEGINKLQSRHNVPKFGTR